MVNSTKVREAYDKRATIYDSFLEKFNYQENIREILAGIHFQTNGRMRMLDVGCGTGLVSEVMLGRFEHCEIVGFDYSPNMLKQYSQRYPFIKAVVGDFNKEDDLRKEGRFDLVISAGAVSEYGERGKAVRNIYNALSGHGTFIDIGNRKNIFSLFTGMVWHYWPMGKKSFVRECLNSGFSYVEDITISWRNLPSKVTKYAVRAVK